MRMNRQFTRPTSHQRRKFSGLVIYLGASYIFCRVTVISFVGFHHNYYRHPQFLESFIVNYKNISYKVTETKIH